MQQRSRGAGWTATPAAPLNATATISAGTAETDHQDHDQHQRQRQRHHHHHSPSPSPPPYHCTSRCRRPCHLGHSHALPATPLLLPLQLPPLPPTTTTTAAAAPAAASEEQQLTNSQVTNSPQFLPGLALATSWQTSQDLTGQQPDKQLHWLLLDPGLHEARRSLIKCKNHHKNWDA